MPSNVGDHAAAPPEGLRPLALRLRLLRRLRRSGEAGGPLSLDEEVYGSAVATNHRNRALARGEVPNPAKGFGPIKLGSLLGFLCRLGSGRARWMACSRSGPSVWRIRPPHQRPGMHEGARAFYGMQSRPEGFGEGVSGRLDIATTSRRRCS